MVIPTTETGNPDARIEVVKLLILPAFCLIIIGFAVATPNTH